MSSRGSSTGPLRQPGHVSGSTSLGDNLFIYQQILDAIPDTAAILDARAVIVAVNQAWRDFAVANGGAADFGVGVDYRGVCSRAAAAGEPDAAHTLDLLNAVQSSESPLEEFEYDCSSLHATRWFMTRVTPVPGTAMTLVTHVNITSQKLAEASVREMAEQDMLTGLANRVGLQAGVAHAERDGVHHPAATGVVYIDLDGFKAVNDTHGHALGDELLQVVAHRLRSATKQHELVARLGGDEFAVVAWDITPEELAALADRLTASVSRPMSLRGVTVTAGASAGTAMRRPGTSISEALEAADAAMYSVKRAAGATTVDAPR